jgi:hypothetical protein
MQSVDNDKEMLTTGFESVSSLKGEIWRMQLAPFYLFISVSSIAFGNWRSRFI